MPAFLAVLPAAASRQQSLVLVVTLVSHVAWPSLPLSKIDRASQLSYLASNNEQVFLLRIPRQSLAADALQSQNTRPILHTYPNPSQGTEEMEGYQVEDTQQTVTNFIH